MRGNGNDIDNHSEPPLILIVSQLVQDIKVGGGRFRQQLMNEVARLRNGLRSKAYIPGDKLNATVEPLIFRDGKLVVDIHGGMLQSSDYQASLDTHIHHKLSLDMKNEFRDQSLESTTFWEFLLNYCNDVQCDAGGNAQNMAINICLAGISSALRGRIRVALLSSSDPFRLMPDDFREIISGNSDVSVHLLEGLSDRYAVQMPWEIGSEHGSFALTTEPADISPIIKNLLETNEDICNLFKQANCCMASDPSFEFFRLNGRDDQCTIINAATKWRTLIATKVYGGSVILPMNHNEASDVLSCMEQIGTNTELHEIERSPFPSPFKPNGMEVDNEQLGRADAALSKLARYNHPHRRPCGKVAFNYPITSEADGGFVVGTRESKSIVAFTTTVHPDKEEKLFEEFGEPFQYNFDRIQTMGAGDAAATVIAILNTVDPFMFFERFFEGAEKRNPTLLHYACTIFASALSRIVGNFLIRTSKCHWHNISLDKFDSLFFSIAEESLNVARSMMNKYGNYHLSELSKWGIRVVVWRLGSISKPEKDDTGAY